MKKQEYNHTQLKATGGTGDRHALRYFCNSSISNTYIIASSNNSLNLPIGTEVQVQTAPVKENGIWYTTIAVNNNIVEVSLNKLFKPVEKINTLKTEETMLQKFQTSFYVRLISSPMKHINIKTPSGLIFKADGFRIEENPTTKADAYFTFKDTPIYWLSHKKGAKVGDYICYQALSSFKRNPVVDYFVQEIKKRNYEQHILDHKVVGLELDYNIESHKILARQCLYGEKCIIPLPKKYSDNNVNVIMYGDLRLIPIILSPYDGSIGFYLTADHYHLNSDIPNYKLVITAFHSADRKDCGLKNTRIQLRREGSRNINYFI